VYNSILFVGFSVCFSVFEESQSMTLLSTHWTRQMWCIVFNECGYTFVTKSVVTKCDR